MSLFVAQFVTTRDRDNFVRLNLKRKVNLRHSHKKPKRSLSSTNTGFSYTLNLADTLMGGIRATTSTEHGQIPSVNDGLNEEWLGGVGNESSNEKQIASVMGNGMGMLEEEIVETIVNEQEKKKKMVKSTTKSLSSSSSSSKQQPHSQIQSQSDQNSKSLLLLPCLLYL